MNTLRNKLGQFTTDSMKAKWQDPAFKQGMVARFTGTNNPRFKNAKKQGRCEICDKAFFYYPSNEMTGKACSRQCSYRLPSRSKRLADASTGKKASKETRLKLSRAHMGLHVGEKNGSWRGGITPVASAIRWSVKYDEWREKVFNRDKFTCLDCGLIGGEIIAHHIIQFAKLLKDGQIKNYSDAMPCAVLWDIKNGVTLCKPCHRARHHSTRRLQSLLAIIGKGTP